MKAMKKQTNLQKLDLKNPTTIAYKKVPFKSLYTKLNNHYNNTITNRYKNSGISCEAQIITNELLAKAKNSTKDIAHSLLKLSETKLSTMIRILSNHN